MGKVIFNSDDFGYSHGVNYGIMDAYQRGILTSTTLMANMPGFEHAVKLRKEMPRKAESSDPYLIISIHLTLTKINCIRNGMLRFKKFIMRGSYQLI